MRLFRVIALLLLSLGASAAMAISCNSGRDLGVMGPPDTDWIGNSFTGAATDYTDCYKFTVAGSAASVGIVWDFFDPRINIDSVSLYGGSSLLGSFADPLLFSFGGLIGGVTYTLAIVSDVLMASTYSPAGYVGIFHTYAAPVPEPATVAMLLLGLVGVGVAVRRKMR